MIHQFLRSTYPLAALAGATLVAGAASPVTHADTTPDTFVEVQLSSERLCVQRGELTQSEWSVLMDVPASAHIKPVIEASTLYHQLPLSDLVMNEYPMIGLSFDDAYQVANRLANLLGVPPAYSVQGPTVNRTQDGMVRMLTWVQWGELVARHTRKDAPRHLFGAENLLDTTGAKRMTGGGSPRFSDGAPLLRTRAQSPGNADGLMNLLGNVSEMVEPPSLSLELEASAEAKALTCGGNFTLPQMVGAAVRCGSVSRGFRGVTTGARFVYVPRDGEPCPDLRLN